MTRPTFPCTFETCRLRQWFEGFDTAESLRRHQLFHQCQWLLITEGSPLPSHCDYMPTDEEDIKAHLRFHIDYDLLPKMKDEKQGMVRWHCPWQTCTSFAFTCKGSKSRHHLIEHVLGHATCLKAVTKQQAQANNAVAAATTTTTTEKENVSESTQCVLMQRDFRTIGIELDQATLDTTDDVLQEEEHRLFHI